MKSPASRDPHPATWRSWLIDLALVVPAVCCAGLACGQTCRIDPSTGQVVCGQASCGAHELPQLYGIPYIPEQPCAAWPEPRAVKLRNQIGDGEFAYVTGSVVRLGGDSSYVLTCAHGLGPAGDPLLVIFSDGRSADIGEVVAVDEADDVGLVRLKGGPRHDFFELADIEPPAGTRVWLAGFPQAGQYIGLWSTIDHYQDFRHPTGVTMSVAVCTDQACDGMSGGHLITADGRLVGVIHSIDPGHTLCARLNRVRLFLASRFPRLFAARGADGRDSAATNEDWQPAAPEQGTADRLDRDLDRFRRQLHDGDQPAEPRYQAAEAPPPVFAPPIIPQPPPPAAAPNIVDAALTGLSGLGFWRLVAGAVAIGSGAGLPAAGVYAATRLAGYVVGRKVRRTIRARHLARAQQPAQRTVPVAIDSPPPPQVTATERHYVPFETDAFRRAHDWACEQVVRKFPGATDIMANLDSLIAQQLAAQPKPGA